MQRKPLFDLVRRLLGRGLSQSEVTAIDHAIDGMEGLSEDPVPPVPSMRVSAVGIQLIKRFEGCASKRPDGLFVAYPDPATGREPWTIGWGATGSDIGPDTIWTQAQCDARLETDVEHHARDVRKAIGDRPTTQGQFDALVSFHYNTGAIGRATLTRLHCTGRFDAAAEEFLRWTRGGERVLKGLVARRRAEALLYRSGR